jgi:hypothetical protein
MAISKIQVVVEQFAKEMASRMEAHVRIRYNVPDFKLKTRISFAPNRKLSRGGTKMGEPFISLVCKRHLESAENNTPLTFYEYAHIKNDPVIGEVKNVSWQIALGALIAHEVAHSIQYYTDTKQSAKEVFGIQDVVKDKMLLNHNWLWQQIYADLRTEFVNGKIVISAAPVVSTPVSTPQKPCIKRIRNKQWRSVSQTHSGTRYVSYFNATGDSIGDLIGVLCANSYGVYRYNTQTRVFVKINAKNLVEARRIEFGI